MNRKEITETLAQSLQTVLKKDIPPGDLHDNTNLFHDIGIDSLSVMEFILQIEQQLGVMLDEETLNVELFEKAGLLIDYLESQLNARVA